MKTRAAVAFEARKPLEIVELDLEGPKAGEVLVEIKATGVCHTDAYTLDGLDSEGLFPSIRATQGKGLMPDGTSRFSYKGQAIAHYMGCSTFSNYTVLPEIAVAKIRDDAPFETSCYIGCGVTTGVGAVVNTAKVEPGANVVVFGLGGIGLNVIQGARLVGAGRIVGVDINPRREEWGRRFGMTHFVDGRGKERA